jgi:hypothetical protein
MVEIVAQGAHMGERRGAYRVLEGKHEGKKPLEDLGVNGRITLKYVGWQDMD